MKNILILLIFLIPALVYAQTYTVTETELLTVNISAFDPDGDSVTIQYSEPLDKNGEWQTGYDNSGEYTSVVTLSDGMTTVKEEIKIIVLDKNRLPVLDKIPILYVKEGETLSYKIEGTDPDGDRTLLSWYKIPKGSKIRNRVFNFTPLHDFVENPEPGFWNKFKLSFIPHKKIYTFRLGLNDTKEIIFVNVTVHVRNVNRAPQLTQYIPVNEARVGDVVKFGIIATDPDDDSLSYTWDFGFFDSLNGDNIVYRKFTKPGIKTVKVKVSDGYRTVVKSWKINVVE